MPVPAPEQRRLVSIVFCDLVGSTSLAGELDPEVLRSVTLRYFELMRECVEAHGGVVEKFIGDAVMAAFGVPHLHEDDPRRALAAAHGMRAALADYNVELEAGLGIRLDVRIGVNTGEVVTDPDPSAGHGFVSGEAVNVAARLEQNAAPGQILVGPATVLAAGAAAVLEPAGDLVLRGKSEPVTAHALIDIRSDAPEVVRRFDVPFVGRRAELAELTLAYERVAEQNTCRLLTVFGDAGIGKTRLVREWLDRAGVRAGVGRCRPYGEAGTLAPLTEAISALSGSVPAGSSFAETVAGMGEVLTAGGPVVLVLDDCQWATPALLDVIDELLDRAALDPVLFLAIARPDLLDARPGWGAGRLSSGTLVLATLTPGDAARLADGLVEVGAHAATSLAEAVARAEGNPLHLEQLVTALLQDGGSGPLPPSVHALLGARIDALSDRERVVLDRAAVIGRDFETSSLAALSPSEDPAPVLRDLTRRRLVEPVRGVRGAFRFTSALIQEVAYAGMAKRVRADRHEQLASFGAAGSGAARHLEAAYRLRSELGAFGPEATALRRRAAAALREAGTEALARADPGWAAELLGRALPLHRAGEAGRADTVRRLGEALLALGRRAEAEALLAGLAGDETEPLAAAHARLLLATHDPAGVARAVLPVFRQAQDRLGLARAAIRLAQEQQFAGRHEEAAALLTQALDDAVAGGAEPERAAALGAVGVSLWLGPAPAAVAVERCQALLAEHGTGRRAVEATLSCPLAVLLAITGDAAAAHARLTRAGRLAADLGYAEAEAFLPLFEAQVQRLSGEPGRAEETLGAALAAARRLGDPALAATAARDLARLVADRHDWPAAAALLGEPDADLPPTEAADDAGLRARLAAAEGGLEEALVHTGRARAHAALTDSPYTRGMAELDLAHVLLAVRAGDEAQESARRAASWFARKEFSPGLAWCAEVGG